MKTVTRVTIVCMHQITEIYSFQNTLAAALETLQDLNTLESLFGNFVVNLTHERYRNKHMNRKGNTNYCNQK